MKKILGLFFVLAGLFCFNSCKNYIDQLSIAGNKYIMTNIVPATDNIDALDLELYLMDSVCILTFNKDGSSYVKKLDSDVVSSGSYEVSTSNNTVTLIDSSGRSSTYTFSENGTRLDGRELWTDLGVSATFNVTYKLN